MSYQYLPAVLKTLLEFTIREAQLSECPVSAVPKTGPISPTPMCKRCELTGAPHPLKHGLAAHRLKGTVHAQFTVAALPGRRFGRILGAGSAALAEPGSRAEHGMRFASAQLDARSPGIQVKCHASSARQVRPETRRRLPADPTNCISAYAERLLPVSDFETFHPQQFLDILCWRRSDRSRHPSH